LELSGEKRIHVMKSLAALAKYTGCYDRWQQIRESFQLKWSNSDPLRDFNSIYNNENDLNHMINWVKNTFPKLPRNYGNFLIFNTLTGLRPSEACTAIGLIHDGIRSDLQEGPNRSERESTVLGHATGDAAMGKEIFQKIFRIIASKMYDHDKEIDDILLLTNQTSTIRRLHSIANNRLLPLQR
jgi:hypothetical protein